MSLSNALSYLTLLPIPFKKEIPLNRSVHYFPLVGAAMGSVLVLVLLGLKTVMPVFLACACAVAVWEGMAWSLHLRSAAEWLEGKHTVPGWHLGRASTFGWKGWATVSAVLLIKIAALTLIRSDWQPFAILLAPILGRSSQALAIIFSPVGQAGSELASMEVSETREDPVVKRRQIRALFIIAVLFFTFGAFPLRFAALLVGEFFALIFIVHLIRQKKSLGLTAQSLGSTAELAELIFLSTCATLSILPAI